MSDYDDDDFPVDDSFLREVDNITAKAATASKSLPSTTVAAPNSSAAARSFQTGFRYSTSTSSLPGFSRPAVAGPSRPRPPVSRPVPSSDDYDDFSLPAEQLLAFDTQSLNLKQPARTPHSPFQSVIPSSRLVRSCSSNDAFLQTHLNFRRENQSTKGKRWDRTAFAESGRRVNVEKAKLKGKGKGGYKVRTWVGDDDEVLDDEDEEDEEDFEPLVPGPKPLVDTNAAYEPQRHLPNPSTVSNYIYPTNRPKRDYQYDIVRACFTDNCLVALPTGLGKTFVAGVVMLNFYRWFPSGKIVFLAPTKPLVNQQIEACQMTCGIPSADAAVMTGQSVSAKERAKLWDERRVFYCTPQTLDNDLKNGSVDPKDIVLAVFDEAHKASGSYAYTTILAYITAHHPYFRVLALTATPGADVVRVQSVVDALHISRIEIREAEAPEIRKYMNDKKTEKHFVQMGGVIESFRDRWAALMKPFVQKLVERDILTDRDLDIKRLKPFRLTAKRMEIARDRGSTVRWAMGSLQSIERMARAMGHLLEFSLGMFHTVIQEIAGNSTATGKKATTKGGANALRNNYEFQKLLRDVEVEINSIRIGQGGKTKADKHPKMVKTLELLLDHFSQAEEDEKYGKTNDTRAMVFCSFRECVMEVVDMLNEHSGLLRATKFVGQSQGKQEGDKGFNQKEQKKTIAEFKEGKYNVLVSTSIGEEGLDIGEVDFVVIYDMPKQSIKLLQRVGRTGRKRDGKVHVLMSENREDANWDSAQQTHREIQEEILHSRNLELFEDVERLLPAGKLPECIEQEMPVDPWDPQDGKRRKRLPGTQAISDEKEKEKPKKKQRGHEIPEGGHEGFKSVSELLRDCGKVLPNLSSSGGNPVTTTTKGKGKGKAQGSGAARGRKKKDPSPVRSESEDEEEVEEDMELLYGDFYKPKVQRLEAGEKRSFSKTTTVPAVRNAKSKGNGRKGLASDDDDDDQDEAEAIIEEQIPVKGKGKGKKTRTELANNGASATGDRTSTTSKRRRPVTISDAEETGRESPVPENDPDPDQSALDFFAAHGPTRRRLTPPLATPPSSPPLRRPIATHPPLSPDSNSDGESPHQVTALDGKLSPRTAALVGFSQIVPVDLTWNADEDDEDETKSKEAATPAQQPSRTSARFLSSSPAQTSHLPSLPSLPSSGLKLPATGSRRRIMGISRKPATPLTAAKSADIMPPPPLPLSAKVLSSPVISMPDTQFPIRRVGKKKAAAVMLPSSEERPSVQVRTTDDLLSPLLPPGRLRRRHADSEDEAEMQERRAKRARQRRKKGKGVGRYLDLDVDISGSEGSSDEPLSDHETAQDREFAGMEFQPTQAPKGYNQHAIYMAGLSTQAGVNAGLDFRHKRDQQREVFFAKARKPVLLTDEESGAGDGSDSENEYEMGSFVVDDEEDVSFDTQMESDPLSGI